MVRSAAAVARLPEFDVEVDVRGLSCPMPALRARAALQKMKEGQVLRLVSTDRGSPRDFARFAQATGNELLAQQTTRREFVFYLRKG
jgi:tRNA 2-thiouridine synthesizing protein A